MGNVARGESRVTGGFLDGSPGGNGSVGRIPQLPTVSRRYGISVLIITDIALAAFISALIVGVSLHYHKIVQNEYWGYPEVPNNFHATAQSFN